MALSKVEYGSFKWEIQPACWRDFSALTQLERTCFPSEDLWPFWDLIGALTLPGLVRLKAVTNDQMVGFIGGELKELDRIGWITTLAVLPSYRRKGIGVALLERCEKTLAAPIIRLSVRASNHTAINLYTQRGYLQADRWRRYYVGGEDALVLEKRR